MKNNVRYFVCIVLFLNSCVIYSQNKLGDVGVESEKINGEFIGGLKIRRDGTQVETYSGSITTGDYIVRNKSELMAALAVVKRGETIFIEGSSIIDLTGENKIRIPPGITLASNRGENHSQGALLFSNLHGTDPLMRLTNDVKLTGLRLAGPDTAIYFVISEKTLATHAVDLDSLKKKGDYYVKMGSLPRSTGVRVEGRNVDIYNCELYGWTMAAISITGSSKNTNIRHNYIHHNQHFGLGYGVVIYKASALIEANLFDYNNHSVTGTGHVGTSFEVINNIFKQNHVRAWAVDMHGGIDRGDGTDIAGDSFIVRNNDFYLLFGRPGINIRGNPLRESKIYNNRFTFLTDDRSINAYQKRRVEIGQPVRIERSQKHTISTAVRVKDKRSLVFDNLIIERN